MEPFDFLTKEWPVITQAPHIALGGLVVALLVTWSVAKWHYSGELASLKQQINTLLERVALALDSERDVKEKPTEAQSRVVELNQQIKANEQQPVLLRSSNSAVAALNHLLLATDRFRTTLTANNTRARAERGGQERLIEPSWRLFAPGIWKASSSWPNIGFWLLGLGAHRN